MADPLSLAASIAGLVSLADTAFRHVYRYARDVKGASGEITRIAQDLHSLAGILQSTRVLAQSLEEEGDAYDPAIRVHHVYQCEKTLSKINDRMKRAAQRLEKGKLRDVLVQHAKWPFSKSETQEVLEELERHKTTMSLSIATDSMKKIQLLLSKQEEMDTVAKETRQVVRELHNDILLDNRKRRVLDFFLDTKTVNPQASLDTNIRLRHPTTGLWLTESSVFTQWLETPGFKIWLSGIPGGGKTVLAGAAIQEALTRASPSPAIAAAFFFCDFKNEKTLKRANIVGAIASQLARQKNEAFDLLQDYYHSLYSEDRLPKEADADDLRALVGKMCELFEQVLIIVDGIDECGEGMDDIAAMLSDLANDSEIISLAIFSRDEVGIRRQLDEDFKSISISAHSKDIELYVRAELESLINRGRLRVTNASLKDGIQEALVDQAQGMFRWVACQLDYLCGFTNDFERREALGHLPPTLHETYIRLLQRLSKFPTQTQSKIQMCFQFIAFCPTRLTMLQLREAISTPAAVGASLHEHMVSEDEIASMCGSLLKKSVDDNCFEFAHFSVREFLEHQSLTETPGLENYRISQSECHRLLAAQSLRYLQLSNFVLDLPDPETVRTRSNMTAVHNEGYSFHRWAARFALEMTAHVNSRSMLHELQISLFRPSKTSCLTLFAMSVFLNLSGQCENSGLIRGDVNVLKSDFAMKMLKDDFRPIHLAAALNLPGVCDHLISTGSDPTAESAFGTPIQLSIASFIQFIQHALDMKAVKAKHYSLCGLILTLLPSGAQRNSTVEILERLALEKPEPHQFLHPAKTELFVPCIIGFVQNDFRVLQRQLSRGATLEDPAYAAVLSELMYRSSDSIKKDTEPLLAFLQHVACLLKSETEWQLDIGRNIWNAAVEMGLPFTRDPLVTDSRITMSKNALVSKAFATIKAHDLPGLETCLADGRLDLSERHLPLGLVTSNGGELYLTLLHYAVLEANLEATSYLAAAGCNPNISAQSGHLEYPPIHSCTVIDIFDELAALGVDITAVETITGQNIWHIYATRPGITANLLESVARRYPLETAEALLTKSNSGDTPLQLALLSSKILMPREDLVERIMRIISVCSDIVGFWSIHEPLYQAAAEYGSERILHNLIEVGARLNPVGPSQETPLHHLGAEASSAVVQCLKELYPRALDARFEGRLPLQLYLERCGHHNHSIEDSVARDLLSTESLESIDGNGTTLWEHYWGAGRIHKDSWRLAHSKNGFEIICDWLLTKNSAILAYERSKRRSGVNMIFSFLIAMDWTQQLASTISPLVLAQVINASCYWESAKGDPSVLRFLQFAIKNQLYKHVDVLLDHGVSVSDVVDGYSSVQIACQPSPAISLCSSADGKEILCRLLDLANDAHLNELAIDGLTILHRLATNVEAGSNLHWLIDRVLSTGVEINKRGIGGDSPIMHHVKNGSLSCAEYLLQMGADPRIRNDFGCDAATEAAHKGFRSFLDKLLENSKTQGPFEEWGRSLSIHLNTEDGRSLNISSPNVLHIACWAGQIESLEFFVDNNLIDDLEASGSDGCSTMHVSAAGGKPGVIEFLSAHGCQVVPQTLQGKTPLHLAVRERHYDACKALIRLGAQDIADFTGITPKMLASNDNDKVMIQLLSELRSSDNPTPQPRKASKALVTAMGRAIQSNNIAECKRLYEMDFPINVTSKGWSPLAHALHKEHLDIAEWLLDNGADTSTCVSQDSTENHGRRVLCLHVIEICLAHSQLNKLLAKLVDHCITDGSGWPIVGNAGLSRAILKGNTEGLSTLLKCVKERAEDISVATNIPRAEVLYTVVNQKNELNDEGWYGTALHYAVEEENVQAVRVLLDSGANVDKTDSNGRTALWRTGIHDIYTVFVRHGASSVDHFSRSILESLDWNIGIFRAIDSSYSEPSIGDDHSPKLPGLFRTIHDTRGSIDCQQVSIDLGHLGPFVEAGIDLNQELGSGRSLVHLAIVDSASSSFILNSNLDLENMAPFPWHLDFWSKSNISFMTSRFSFFRKRLAEEDLARLAHLQPVRGWSPLCHASVVSNIDMIDNCLSLGADLDFEGSPHGSAVIVASACGQIEAVRTLVRAGASLSYRGEKGHRSVFTFCRSKVVRRWLLVDRFTEQRMIDVRPHWEDGQRVRLWLGPAVARLKLVGDRAMLYHETSIDYAGRLVRLRKWWRGRAIPPVCLDGFAWDL